MQILKEEELSGITGGGVTMWVVIGCVGTFILGVFTGLYSLINCN